MWKKILIACLILALAGAGILLFWWHGEERRIHQYDSYIEEASKKYDVPADLVRAVIWRESDFDSSAQGKAGERGLMQVSALVGREWAKYERIPSFQPTDLFDARTNILTGSWYLAQAMRRWSQADEPIIFALAEYNAGRSQALRWFHSLPAPVVGKAFFNQIDYPSTRNYISAILQRYQLYRSSGEPGPTQSLMDKFSRRLQPSNEKNVAVETTSER